MYLNGRKVVLVNPETAKAESLMWRYNQNIGYDLFDVYGKPSDEKRRIYFDCKVYCNQVEGKDFHIAGKSGYVFTVCFKNNAGCHILTRDSHYIVLNGRYTKAELKKTLELLEDSHLNTVY